MLSKKQILRISYSLVLAATSILAYDELKHSIITSFLEQEKKEINLILGGDLMLSRGIGRWAKKQGYDRTFTSGGYHPLNQFASYLSGESLLIFNLESPFATKDNDNAQGGFLFRANTGNLQILQDLKGTNQMLLSLANNHTSNAGGAGISLTREVLSGADIYFAGAGNSTGEARHIWQQTINEIGLCFQAYSYDGNFNYYGKIPLARNPLKEEVILEDIQKMKAMNCNLKILSLHRGREYRLSPTKEQTRIAHRLIDAGADIILGGHSHIPGKYEIYNGKPIFYSMGNLLFDQDRGMKAKEAGFDYIWDYELKRRTVPTYIPLLAEIKVSKTQTGIDLSLPNFKMARIVKGKYQPLDQQTFSGILATISPESAF